MSKREGIEPNPSDKRYIRHNSKTNSKPGQSDHGDGYTGNC